MDTDQLVARPAALGPLVAELERYGCTMTIVEGPSATGQLVLRVLFPEDEYLEKRCRLLLDGHREPTAH